MKIVIVCSINKGKIAPFISEQVDSLRENGIQMEYFLIKGKGIFGYLKNYPKLRKKIIKEKPNLIHAHYGFSSLLANLQRKAPVVTTFHGSDVNNSRALIISKLAHRLSKCSIFVEESMKNRFRSKPNDRILPCGVNLANFSPNISNKHVKDSASRDLYQVLFSSSFNKLVKNYPLAEEAIQIIEREFSFTVQLIELKGLNRSEVNSYINKADCALLTSFSEGSPQFIKEAMSCNCPIVSTNVGDVKILFGEEQGHYLTSYDPDDVAINIKNAIEYRKNRGTTRGRDRIIELELDTASIAKRLIEIYAELNADTN